MRPWAPAGTKTSAAITAFYSPYENSVFLQWPETRAERGGLEVKRFSFHPVDWLIKSQQLSSCLVGLVCYWLIWWEKEIIRTFKAEKEILWFCEVVWVSWWCADIYGIFYGLLFWQKRLIVVACAFKIVLQQTDVSFEGQDWIWCSLLFGRSVFEPNEITNNCNV